jgi:hypothetical protein
MRGRFTATVLMLLSLAVSKTSLAAQDNNLRTCVDGRYPTLCDHSALSADQRKVVAEAEHHANLWMCMDGRYRTLCDHSHLTADEAERVRQAERVANLKMCIDGRYPSLCRHELLSSSETEQVNKAEAAANMKICLDGRYPTLCNHALLSDPENEAVGKAEAVAAAAAKKDAPKTPISLRGAAAAGRRCEDGHSLSAVEGDGKILKLDDGTIWEVDDSDSVTSSVWVVASEVIVCGSKIINTDDKESVEVTPVEGRSSRARSASGKSSYVVQAAANDETFVINDQVFKAKTYCFNIDKGDRVIFVSGSASGACSSAKILNLRTSKVCDVWCE